MAVQVAQLLAGDEDLPGEVRRAIADGRLAEAGLMLMDRFELTCEEAGDLVDRALCDEEQRSVSPQEARWRSRARSTWPAAGASGRRARGSSTATRRTRARTRR